MVLHSTVANRSYMTISMTAIIRPIVLKLDGLECDRIEMKRGLLRLNLVELRLDLVEVTRWLAPIAIRALGTSWGEVTHRFVSRKTFERVAGDDRAGMSNYLSSLIDQKVLRPCGIVHM